MPRADFPQEPTVPVVDISDLLDPSTAGRPVVDAIARACRGVGFASVVGHGIEPEVLADVRRLLVELFALPDDRKRAQPVRPHDYRGFIPLGYFTPNEGGELPPDAYEGFKVQWECPPDHPVRAECPLYGSNHWPKELPELPDVITRYWVACDRVAAALGRAFASALGLPDDTFHRLLDAPLTNMTLLHYPPRAASADGYGIHPHKDTCAYTMLHPDPVGGLELRTRDGEWLEVVAPDEALVVNIGDMLEVWSGGRFVSTPHRVVNHTGVDRYSAPYFVVPNHAVVVEPLLAPLTGFDRHSVNVGVWTAETWRTNWPDAERSQYEVGTVEP